MASSPTKLSLKLLIDKKSQRVIFAEAEKDFVDFLFHILSLPLGSVVNIVSKENIVGSLGKLYGSIETMKDVYILPEQKKSTILNPHISNYSVKVPLMLASGNTSSTSSNMKHMYRCNYLTGCLINVTDDPSTLCPNCNNPMSSRLCYLAGTSNGKDLKFSTDEGGYVKGIVTYTIRDDLSVMPMSTLSSITLLTSLNIKDFASVEEKVVYVSMTEGVELLKTSLHSKTVLTDVFLKKKEG